MIIRVTGRHLEIGEALRDYVQSKISKLDRIMNNVVKVEVTFDTIRVGHYEAKLVVSLPRNHVIVCSEREKSLTAAFDLTIGAVERQLSDYKEKLRGKGARAKETRRFLRKMKAHGSQLEEH